MDKKDILHKFPPLMENMLLILHEFQNSNPHHYLPEGDLAMIAGYLNVPYSTVYGVVSYYSMFSLTPRGKHIIRLCNSPVCQVADSNEILAKLCKYLSIDVGATTADDVFTLETTECLGQCDSAPGMSVDEQYYGNLTGKKIKSIIMDYRIKMKKNNQ
jgi:NADH:ubiquinone oxidoreductase subunit E